MYHFSNQCSDTTNHKLVEMEHAVKKAILPSLTLDTVAIGNNKPPKEKLTSQQTSSEMMNPSIGPDRSVFENWLFNKQAQQVYPYQPVWRFSYQLIYPIVGCFKL